MSGIQIEGGCRLTGSVRIQGSKNAVLPVLAASLLHAGITVFSRVPEIADVWWSRKILEELGVRTEFQDHTLWVDASGAEPREIPRRLGEKMRSSVLFLGPLLARFGSAALYAPGGCAIGRRPVDYHLAGLRRLGARLEEQDGRIRAWGPLGGGLVSLPYPSVGATEQLLLAACGAGGETCIQGAAREPEIVTLCRYLRRLGAWVEGEGTDRIRVRGFRPVRGTVSFAVPGDRIAAGTYLAMGAVTGGRLRVEGISPAHLWAPVCAFRRMGCELRLLPEEISLSAPRRLSALPRLATAPYPAFPTDLQSSFLTMMAVAQGESVLEENVFESRLALAGELNRMGARIRVQGRRAVCQGVPGLRGAAVRGTDLRSGAALAGAALAAEGCSRLEGFEHVERGYEGMIPILQSLGARVERTEENAG